MLIFAITYRRPRTSRHYLRQGCQNGPLPPRHHRHNLLRDDQRRNGQNDDPVEEHSHDVDVGFLLVLLAAALVTLVMASVGIGTYVAA